jgi:dephospho-CoA kinase
VESTRGYDYGAVLVVEAPRELRLARLEARGLARADAERRMALQASDEERRERATWVLDNSGDVADLERQINAIWPELEKLAQEPPEETSETT